MPRPCTILLADLRPVLVPELRRYMEARGITITATMSRRPGIMAIWARHPMAGYHLRRWSYERARRTANDQMEIFPG